MTKKETPAEDHGLADFREPPGKDDYYIGIDGWAINWKKMQNELIAEFLEDKWRLLTMVIKWFYDNNLCDACNTRKTQGRVFRNLGKIIDEFYEKWQRRQK